ncbi:MAG TPA: DUF1361 domain-containing protein [Ignavibacteriaceae bacterium]|nr:DUF1361 domain-containing protein [Ignavibacteriaceae bacterium]
MIKKLISANRFNFTASIFLLGLFSFTLYLCRVIYTGSFEFLFLNWNLFLASIPFLISSLIILHGLQKNKKLLLLWILCWILFFPNSPYILTDLFHLNMSTRAPAWYDLILILSYSWTALLCGAVSLMDIEKVLAGILGRGKATAFIVVYLFLSGFGIYLGRYQRWNSWSVLDNPSGLFGNIFNIFAHPLAHPKSWALTILVGTLLNLLYFSFKFIKIQRD